MGQRYNSEMHVAVGGAWQRAGMRLLRQVEIPAAYRVLDVGCGTGELTLAIARCVPEGGVVGVDRSPELIALAQASASKAGAGNVRLIAADLLEFEPEAPFDLVYSNSTLHLVRPGVAALVRIAKWVTPGGKLALQTPARDLSEEVHQALEAALASIHLPMPFPTWSSPWFLPPAAELAATVRDAGLVNVRAMEEMEPLSFRSPEDASAYFRGLLLGPYLEQLPAERHEDFLAAFGEAFPLENGLPSCLLKRVYVVGERPGS